MGVYTHLKLCFFISLTFCLLTYSLKQRYSCDDNILKLSSKRYLKENNSLVALAHYEECFGQVNRNLTTLPDFHWVFAQRVSEETYMLEYTESDNICRSDDDGIDYDLFKQLPCTSRRWDFDYLSGQTSYCFTPYLDDDECVTSPIKFGNTICGNEGDSDPCYSYIGNVYESFYGKCPLERRNLVISGGILSYIGGTYTYIGNSPILNNGNSPCTYGNYYDGDDEDEDNSEFLFVVSKMSKEL